MPPLLLSLWHRIINFITVKFFGNPFHMTVNCIVKSPEYWHRDAFYSEQFGIRCPLSLHQYSIYHLGKFIMGLLEAVVTKETILPHNKSNKNIPSGMAYRWRGQRRDGFTQVFQVQSLLVILCYKVRRNRHLK